jgi:hypothetical protein
LVASISIDADVPPTAIVSVPVPICALLATACEVRLAAAARFCTANEYCPATASEVVVTDAIVLSATVPV